MKAKIFLWKDKSGRGGTCRFNQSQLLNIENCYGWGDDSLHTFAREAEVGDEWEDNANKYTRIV